MDFASECLCPGDTVEPSFCHRPSADPCGKGSVSHCVWFDFLNLKPKPPLNPKPQTLNLNPKPETQTQVLSLLLSPFLVGTEARRSAQHLECPRHLVEESEREGQRDRENPKP